MNNDVVWFEHKPSPTEKACQWYLHNEPCEQIAIGVRAGERKTHVHRFRKPDGSEHDVYWINGVLPDVGYEILEPA